MHGLERAYFACYVHLHLYLVVSITVSPTGIRLGNIVPDFAADTTHGTFDSFHEWKKGKWAILFSHPADFTPVCTTEIGRLAMKYDELQAMDCLVATLSVDPVKSHTEWLRDVVAHCENEIEVKFPIIGDADRSISMAYGMIDPGSSDQQQLVSQLCATQGFTTCP